jgi:hypothetical protein
VVLKWHVTSGAPTKLWLSSANQLRSHWSCRPVFVAWFDFRWSFANPATTSHDFHFFNFPHREPPTTPVAIDIHDLCGSTAMGIWDTITDLVEAATPWSTAEAEAPSTSGPAGAGPAKESAVRHPTLGGRDRAMTTAF